MAVRIESLKQHPDWQKEKECEQDAIMQIAIIAGLLFNTAYCEIQNSIRHQENAFVQWDTVLAITTVGIYCLCTLFALRQWFHVNLSLQSYPQKNFKRLRFERFIRKERGVKWRKAWYQYRFCLGWESFSMSLRLLFLCGTNSKFGAAQSSVCFSLDVSHFLIGS